MTKPLTPDDLAEKYPGTNRQTWAQKRYEGTGPAFFKIGRRVFYRPEDVEAWEASQVRTRTDDLPAIA